MNPPQTEADENAGDWLALPISAVAALYVAGIQKFVRENLVVFFGAGTGFALSDSLGWREFGLIAAFVLLGGLLLAMVYHRRFRYRVDSESIRVRQGLFEQKELKVRFERVQNVGFSQPVYIRPLGLTRVELQTPGAAQTEVNLPGIPTVEAEQLRDLIAGARGREIFGTGVANSDVPAQDSDAQHEPAVFEAGTGDLFRYGMTSNQIWIFVGALGGPAFNRIEHWVSSWIQSAEQQGWISAGELAGSPVALALLVAGFLVVLALLMMSASGLMAIIRYHGYRLTLEDDRFKARFGLLDAREKTLRKNKLHSLELVQTAIGRLLGRWHAVGHQASVAVMDGLNGKDQRFLIPGIGRSRLESTAGALVGRDWRFPDWRPIDVGFRRILFTRISAPILVAALFLWWQLEPSLYWLPLLVLSFNGFLLLMVHLRWKRWGYSFDADRLQIRQGLIGQNIAVFEFARCQQVRVTSSPYQRRRGLATLTLRLPHGEQVLPYLPAEVAAMLANRALVRVESALYHSL